jgi:surface carbohydrate biosynthesis protein
MDTGSSRKPRVAYIVDHPLRDLGGLVLTGLNLIDRGVDVFFIPMQYQVREVFSLLPDLVVLPYIRNNNAALLEGLLRARIPYVLLETEGGFYGDLSKYGQTLSREPRFWAGLKKFFVWGEKMRRYLRDDISIPSDKLLLTGLPRFDVYAPSLRHVALAFLPQEWKESPKRLILINTKVSVANPQFISRQKEIDLYLNVLNMPKEEVDRHLTLGLKAIDGTIDIARDLSRTFPDAAVMIRPHPHERMQTYLDGVGAGFSNVSVTRQGTVAPWLVRSSVLIQRHCTTAIEAALAGIPIVAPEWLATSANLPDAEDLSVKCSTVGELHRLVRSAVEGHFEIPAEQKTHLDRIIDDWLYRVDGESSKRVANGILDLLGINHSLDERVARDILYGAYFDRPSKPMKLYHALNILAKHTGIAKPVWAVEEFRSRNFPSSGKGFSIQDILRYADAARPSAGAEVKGCRVLTTDGYPSSSLLLTTSGKS